LHGSYTLLSAEGVHQGDPLGPLLFSLGISEALTQSKCTFTAGYLDDISLGDTVQSFAGEITKFQVGVARVGLFPNNSKFEIIGLSEEARPNS